MALNLNKTKIGRKIFLLAVACGVLGALNFFQPLALALYVLQTKTAVKPVSGDVVVVGIDSPSISAIGRWPWPRDKQAELLRKIDAYEPAAVYVDIGYQGKTTAYADNALRTTLANMKAPTKVIALAARSENNAPRSIFSDRAVIGSADEVSASLPYLFGFVWDVPIAVETERGPLVSLAASIADLNDRRPATTAIDYTYDPKSVRIISPMRLFEQTAGKDAIKGKTVILGVTDPTQNDIHSMPGWGDQPGVVFHALGAETLKGGIPVSWGWLSFFAAALVICGVQLTRHGLRYSKSISLVGGGAILIASTSLTTFNIGNNPLPALALVASVSILVSRQKAALMRAQRNSATGLFNMTGYMVEEVVSNAVFIGATLTRADTRLGYVRQEDEVAIIKEVGHRLSTVIDEQQLTNNDSQQFLWEMPGIATSKLADHLEGLRQLFAEPMLINGRKVDIDIFFGVDRNVNKNIQSRMQTALEASIEASKSQSTFIIATTTEFDALLKSQFTSEFEKAVSNGDIELVLEAQKDLANNVVDSAAASLRWTHPAYGQIDTAKLFATARDTGNLKIVSRYLCKQAMIAAAHVTRMRPTFAVSVKVSTDVISSPFFESEMLEVALDAHCPPANVIFEIIDIHNHKFNDQARQSFLDLKRSGFQVCIGNFGLTDADIDFIKKFNPDEIVLAKSFSAELLGSTSNEIFAVGALRIARASHVIVTADAIDDRDVLSALVRNGCNRVRGKIISIPMNLMNFSKSYLEESERKVG